MAHAVGALSDLEIARFAEIVLPGVAVIFPGGFIEHERLVVPLAAVGIALGGRKRDAACQIAVAPVHEGLRVGKGGSLLDRKADLRVDREILIAALSAIAAVGNDLTRRTIGETAVVFDRPFGIVRADIVAWLARRAACDAQRLDEAFGDRRGFTTGQAPAARHAVEALDGHHVRHAEAGERVTHITFADHPAKIRKLRCERLHRLALAGERVLDVVEQQGCRHLHFDRLRIDAGRHIFASAALQHEHSVVTGGTCFKHRRCAEARLIARDQQIDRATALVGEIKRAVEREENRDWAKLDAGEDRRRHGVDLRDRRDALRRDLTRRRARPHEAEIVDSGGLRVDFCLQLGDGRWPVRLHDRQCRCSEVGALRLSGPLKCSRDKGGCGKRRKNQSTAPDCS